MKNTEIKSPEINLDVAQKFLHNSSQEILILLLTASAVMLRDKIRKLTRFLKLNIGKDRVPEHIVQDINYWLHSLLREIDCNGVMMYYKETQFVATKPGYTLDKPHQLFGELKLLLRADWMTFSHTSYGEYMIRGIIVNDEMCSYLLVYDIDNLSFVYDTTSVYELIKCIERDYAKQ